MTTAVHQLEIIDLADLGKGKHIVVAAGQCEQTLAKLGGRFSELLVRDIIVGNETFASFTSRDRNFSLEAQDSDLLKKAGINHILVNPEGFRSVIGGIVFVDALKGQQGVPTAAILASHLPRRPVSENPQTSPTAALSRASAASVKQL